MSEGVAVAVIISLPGMAAAYLTWKNGRRADRIADKREEAEAQTKKDIDAAARKVEMVKVVLADNQSKTDAKLDKTLEIAHATHTLVNSNMESQLQISAAALREVADLKKKMGLDSVKAERAAEFAEELLAEHRSKQGIVDVAVAAAAAAQSQPPKEG